MNEGDEVRVTNLNGETAEGTIDEVLDVTVDEYEPSYVSVEGATLWNYWRGEDVDRDEQVVVVELGGREYDYPESRVEVVGDG